MSGQGPNHPQPFFPIMKLLCTLLLACLGAAPVHAQQAEPKTEAQKPAVAGDAGSANGGVKPESQAPTAEPGRRSSHTNALPQPEQKPDAYLGVLTCEAPVELRAQFSLAEGFGLLVEEVIPDSPAKAAGLKVYDVLVKFEDQKLVNMEQLKALVRAKKKGDVVQLDVITGGKETKVPVTLGEHLVEAGDHYLSHHRYHGEMEHPHGMPFFNSEWFRGGEQHGFQNPGNELQEHMERVQHFQQEMREFQERLQAWAKGGSTGARPQPPTFNLPGVGQQFQEGGRHHRQPQTGISIPPGTNLERFNFSQSQSAANTTRRDDSGEYTLKNEDGKKTFIARPNHGQEQSWPVNTDAERQAVPQEFQNKLKMMDHSNIDVPMEIHPGPGVNELGPPPALPPVKAKTTSA